MVLITKTITEQKFPDHIISCEYGYDHSMIETHRLKNVVFLSQNYPKLVCAIFLSNFYFLRNDSPSETRKNVFNFI